MTESKTIKVGILGFGTVGAGTAECLIKNHDVILTRTGLDVQVVGIADLDITTDRGVEVPKSLLTTDTESVINESDIIVELIGGIKMAKTFIEQALRLGKKVVTANKALLAEFGAELFKIADTHNASIYYEASVAGGIPIIKSMREGLVVNRIFSIYGILNGTCNYILSQMQARGISFETALQEAQTNGYAEANPSLDIEGKDTAHKIAILASLAYGKWFGMKPVYVEGIEHIELKDISFAEQMGYRIKLLGITKIHDGQVEMRVHPTLVSKEKVLANVDGVFNAVDVKGDYVGDVLLSGRGAGRNATASAVAADVVDAAINMANQVPRRFPFREGARFKSIKSIDDVETRYYMRLECKDSVGAYAKITRILCDNKVSISGILQHEAEDDTVTVIITTHQAREGDVNQAINDLQSLPELNTKIARIRIEKW